MTFGECSDTVIAKDVTNLRLVPSTLDTENVVGQLSNGETLIRTGYSADFGWSHINYNGQTLYVVSSYVKAEE